MALLLMAGAVILAVTLAVVRFNTGQPAWITIEPPHYRDGVIEPSRPPD